MKFKPTQEQTTKAMLSFLVLAGAIAFLLLLLNIKPIFEFLGRVITILSPFIIGFALAYVLKKPIILLETKVLYKIKKKGLRRGISVTVSLLVFLFILAALVAIIIPGIVDSVSKLAANMPEYLKSFQKFLEDTPMLKEFSGSFASDWETYVKSITDFLSKNIPAILDYSVSITVGISNFLIGIVISIYLMMSRERYGAVVNKVCFAIFPDKFAYKLKNITMHADRIFSSFISGKLFESLIIGAICFIGMVIIRLPYALLISVIIAITNLIPFFGPFIGGIPSALLLLVINPMYALYFVIFIVILQQVDGQIIGPRILGDSVGLSAFWVIFGIILGGGLFGVLGMILGVPAFAVLYALTKEFIDTRMSKKTSKFTAE